MTKPAKKRRGRPPASDSKATRAQIIDVARIEFGNRGYEAASISAIAAGAGLAPSAVYHYFTNKAELYEAVFEDTAGRNWDHIGKHLIPDGSVAETIESLIGVTATIGDVLPHYSEFLTMVPTEARLHPEFEHLLKRRSEFQNVVFDELTRRGLVSGELAGFDNAEEATEALRSLLIGWFNEVHRDRDQRVARGRSLLQLFRSLGSDSQRPRDGSSSALRS